MTPPAFSLLEDATALAAHLVARPGALLGLDIGKKRIGIAIAQSTLRLATPLATLHRTRFTRDADFLIALIKERQINALICGLPLHVDGTEGSMCQHVRQFIRNLQKQHSIPVYFQDERFTSQIAEEKLSALHPTAAGISKSVDKVAAMEILQTALDQLPAAQNS